MLQIAVQLQLNDLYVNKKWEELAAHQYLYLKPEWAWQLVTDEKNSVRESLAQNESLAQLPEVALALSKDAKEYVRQALAANPAIAEFPEIALALSQDPNESVRFCLALNLDFGLFPEIVLAFARDPNFRVRGTLASNPAIAEFPEIALALSKDPKEYVRQALAENPAIAEFPEIALILAGDLRVEVREAICGNPAVKKLPKVLQKAGKRTFKYCTVEWVEWEPNRYGSLRHPVKVERSAENCTITFTPGLAHIVLPDGTRFTKRRSTPTWSYRAHRRPTPSLKGVKRDEPVPRPLPASPALSPELALALSQDPDNLVRSSLAANPAIAEFPEVVLALSQDPSPAVRSSLPRKIRIAALRAIAENPAITRPTNATSSIN